MTEDLTAATNTKEFSLQQRALHELAKKFWGEFILREIIDGEPIFIPDKTEKLIAHRDTILAQLSNSLSHILTTLPRTVSTKFPERLKDKLVDAVIYLQQGYHEALIWEKKCQSALTITALNPLTADKYKAGNFIDPLGHFDDLRWAKYFVADNNQFVQCRFELACFYGFEETINHLWQSMKINHQLPCDGRLALIRSVFGDIVGLWAYQLENKFDELIEEDNDYADGFYVCGFTEAIYTGHEYAARFFWEKCLDSEKNKFLQAPNFDFLSTAAENNHAGLVNFIYSLLPIEQKNNLILWTMQNTRGTAWVWSCLLRSPFYASALNDIQTLPFPIPSKIYESLLSSLAFKIQESQIPIHKTIFQRLWKQLSQEQGKEVLEMGFYILSTLVKIKAVDLLETIILSLDRSVKENILLNDWRNAGRSALHEFAEAEDYDSLLRYLLFFFIDYHSSSQTLSLCVDATNFLDRFIQGEFFIYWTETELTESQKKAVDKVIENLQGSLQVIDNLLEHVEQTNSSISEQSLKRPVEDDEETTPPKKQKLDSAHTFTLFPPVRAATQTQTVSQVEGKSYLFN